jgi:hypothetical protein
MTGCGTSRAGGVPPSLAPEGRAYADGMSVPIKCPSCGVGHLHASVYVAADASEDRFQVLRLDGDQLVVRDTGSGTVRTDEGHLLCCACDWWGDFSIALVAG